MHFILQLILPLNPQELNESRGPGQWVLLCCFLSWHDCGRSGDNLVVCGKTQLEPVVCGMRASWIRILF